MTPIFGERERNVGSGLFTILTVLLTSISAVGLGIVSAYGSVLLILHAVSYGSSPVQLRPMALASESSAGGD
jgi:hypothetical protein